MSGYLEEVMAPGEVNGTAGDDRLYGGKGADRVDGREGVDTFFVGTPFAETFVARDGSSTIVGAGAYRDMLVDVEFIQFADVLVRLDDPVLQQTVQHVRSEGADLLIGNDLGYTLEGRGGDDVFIGNGGDDSLYGGKGNDTAVYRGDRADYEIEYDTASGHVFVHDQTSGRDGSDRLHGIEALRFADGELALQPAAAALPAVPVPGDDGATVIVDYTGAITATSWLLASTSGVHVALQGPPEAVASITDDVAIDLVGLIGLQSGRSEGCYFNLP